VDLLLIAKAIGALSVVGIVTSAVLATAAKRFYVEVDERVEAVAAVLPGSNCGACGNPSCMAVAEAMVEGTVPATACVAGGQKVADAVATIMGLEPWGVVAVISARACGGGDRAVKVYDYYGVQSCAAAHRLAGGPLACRSGCLGMGDCVRACPFGAIALDSRGLPVIDPFKCTGCGICVKECPRGQIGLLTLVPDDAPVVVRCNAHTKIKERRASCSACCIACKKCERECPHDAIHVIDLVAVIDYEKCTGCGTCVTVCPTACIDFHGRAAEVDTIAADGLGPNSPGSAQEDGAA
jgi:RnfABCDGE-type electron transport complex B subunit